MTSILQLRPVKMLISIGGIYISYIYFGIIMERLFNHNYTGETTKGGKYTKFSFGFATSIFQNILSFIVAFCVNKYQFGDTKSKMNLQSELLIASCSFGSVFLAAQALAYVSFPVQALMKSSKIISILIVSILMRSSATHTKKQYFCGFIITLGIVIFNLNNEKKKGEEKETTLIGLFMLLGSLFCDGLLGTKQTEIKKTFKPSQWDQMQSLNKYASIICFSAALLSGQLFGLITFISKYPSVVTDLVLLALLGTFGQIFIFYTIFHFTPLFLSIVTTTRKFFTVLASIVIYGHPVNINQGLAIILVFVGVSIEMLSEKKEPAKEKDDKIEYTQVPSQELRDIRDLEK